MAHTLVITVEVEDKVEAYKTVNRVAYEHNVKKAKIDQEPEEVFDETHPPKDFLKE